MKKNGQTLKGPLTEGPKYLLSTLHAKVSMLIGKLGINISEAIC